MIKYLKRITKQRFCNHSEWDCDNQIRVIRCRKCGKKAWIKEYTNFMSDHDYQYDKEVDFSDIILKSFFYIVFIAAILSGLLFVITLNIR